MKKCSRCKELKPLESFNKNKREKDGHEFYCRECSKELLRRRYYKNHEESKLKRKKYREENPEKIKAEKRKYRLKHHEYLKEKDRIRYWNNREELNKKYYDWVKRNRHKINAYSRNKYNNNIQFRLSILLRRRIHNVLKNKDKRNSAVRDLGCSIADFMKYIESLFQPGMSWENYGFGNVYNVWHLDHKIPLASFDLTDREQFLRACHYTNIQPLWAIDNIRKSDFLPEELKDRIYA